MTRMTRAEQTPPGLLRRWSHLLGIGRPAAGRRLARARKAVILFESLEGRAVPAALPIATAVPAAIPPTAPAITATPRAVAVPSSAPAAPTTVALAVASDSGTRNDNITNIITPMIQGRAAAGTRVTVTVTGVAGRPADLDVAVPSVRVQGNGIWTVRLPKLAAGPHTVTARVTNTAGQRSEAASYSFSVDTTRPTGQFQFTPNTDTVVVQFSERVSGVALRNVFITGRTADRISFLNVRLTDPRITQLFGPGSIRLLSSPDGRTWTIKTAYALATPGTYTLRLANTGIADAAGNTMLTSPTLTTRIV